MLSDMARVTITIEDTYDTVTVEIESIPGFPGPAAKDKSCTHAQWFGAKLFEHLTTLMEQKGSYEVKRGNRKP